MLIFAKLFNFRQIKTLKPFSSFFFSNDKQQQSKTKSSDALIERQEKVSLMEDTFQKVKMQGLQDRAITGIDSFQRDILTQNKFDLLNPKIQPKIASLSTTMGLQLGGNNYLAQINLGKIKVKKQNEVFLSEVDPYNIPQYYDIVFDYEKQMSLVGKKVEGTKGKQIKQMGNTAEMNVSTRKAFQQKSSTQIMKQVFGVEMSYILNSRIAFKHFLIALAMTYFISSPIIETYLQYSTCLQSIAQIEEQRMKHINKLKRQSMINAIINNPDMNIQ